MKAFPSYEWIKAHGQMMAVGGMDLRDYFASRAMQKYTFRSPRGSSKTDAEWMLIDAQECYEIADAMMKAREK